MKWIPFILRGIGSLFFLKYPTLPMYLVNFALDALDCNSGIRHLGWHFGYDDCHTFAYKEQDIISDLIWRVCLFIKTRKTPAPGAEVSIGSLILSAAELDIPTFNAETQELISQGKIPMEPDVPVLVDGRINPQG